MRLDKTINLVNSFSGLLFDVGGFAVAASHWGRDFAFIETKCSCVSKEQEGNPTEKNYMRVTQ